MWIKGSELLNPPYKFSRLQVFQFIRDGKLIPREECSSLYRDPNVDPPSSRRYLWLKVHSDLLGELDYLQYQIYFKKSWLRKSKADQEIDNPPEEVARMKREYPEKINCDLARVRELQDRLRPDRVWLFKMAPRIQDEIIEVFVSDKCVYWDEENTILCQHTATEQKESTPLVDTARRILLDNPGASLSEIANSKEMAKAFPMLAPSTIEKRLRGSGLVERGRRKNT